MKRDSRIDDLAARAVADPARIVLIDSLPGTGRLALLDAIARRLTVTGDSAEVMVLEQGRTLDPAATVGRAFVVGTAGQIAGLADLRLRGGIREIGNRDLFLAGADRDAAGWPLLSQRRGEDAGRDDVVAWLRDVVWPSLEGSRQDALLGLCRAGSLRRAACPLRCVRRSTGCRR